MLGKLTKHVLGARAQETTQFKRSQPDFGDLRMRLSMGESTEERNE